MRTTTTGLTFAFLSLAPAASSCPHTIELFFPPGFTALSHLLCELQFQSQAVKGF